MRDADARFTPDGIDPCESPFPRRCSIDLPGTCDAMTVEDIATVVRLAGPKTGAPAAAEPGWEKVSSAEKHAPPIAVLAACGGIGLLSLSSLLIFQLDYGPRLCAYCVCRISSADGAYLRTRRVTVFLRI